MKESAIYQKLKKLSYYFKFLRVETGSTEIGVPDLYYYSKKYYNVHGWIELKQTTNGKIRYQPGQLNNLKKMKTQGIKVFLLFFWNDRFFLTDQFEKDYTKDVQFLWTGKTFNTHFIQILEGWSYETYETKNNRHS